jgi:hypothetical protein
MKIVCAYCQAEGRPGVLGEMEPQEDPTVTYGICPEHRLRVEEEARVATTSPPRGEQKEGQSEAPRFEGVPVSLAVIGRAPQFLGTALQGMARYVSEVGMTLEFPVEVVQGTVLRVVLQTPQGPLEVEGEIVWTSFHGGVIRHGLAFPERKRPDFVDLVIGEKR